MILEAYAKYLQKADDKICATEILSRWLWERLSVPAETTIDRVLHCELRLLRINSVGNNNLSFKLANYQGLGPLIYVFRSKSPSGTMLLKSLYEYSLSYEQQKWARFVHSLKASDFRKIAPSQY